MLAAGTRLGPYEVLDILGAGGMGEVYRARDPRLGRDVAVKVLPTDRVHDADAVARFEREARAVAALSHPNILAVFDIGVDNRVTYLVAELLKGESLRARLQRGALPWRKAAEIAAAVAAGLAAAHDSGIIHRDLKPENLFLTSDGHVKILDFGLARLRPPLESAQTVTATADTDPGTVLGTVGYMSPEQVRGHAADARSDLFSLGSVLHEMVTGTRAFQRGTSVETMTAILNEEPAEPRDSTKRLPPELNLIVRHCLEKRPGDRFQTAHDLAFALRAALSGSSPAASLGQSGPRRSWVVVAGISAALVVALVGWAYLARQRPAQPPTALALDIKRLTNTGRASEPAISPDSRVVVYVDNSVAGSSLRLHQIATGSDVQLVPPAGLELWLPRFSTDGAYVYYLAGNAASFTPSIYRVPAIGGAPREVIRDAIEPPAFSPDGQTLAFVRSKVIGVSAQIMVASIDGSNERVLMESTALTHSPLAWSPDGTELAVTQAELTAPSTFIAVSVKGGRSRRLTDRSWHYLDHPVWLAEGRGLLFLATEKDEPVQIWHLDPATGGARRLTNHILSFNALSAARDGYLLVADVIDSDGAIWIGAPADPSSWRQIEQGAGRKDGAGGLAWTDDGRLVYTTRTEGPRQIWVMSPDGTNRRPLLIDGDNFSPAVSPDGRVIAFTSSRGGIFNIWRAAIDGSDPRQLSHFEFAGQPTWPPDSRWIVFLGLQRGQSGVFRVPAEGGEPQLMTDRLLHRPSVSPDGKWVVALSRDDQQRMIAAAVPYPDGGPLRLFPKAAGLTAWGIAWAPDGSLVYTRQEANKSKSGEWLPQEVNRLG